jgi:hypothetical protein
MTGGASQNPSHSDGLVRSDRGRPMLFWIIWALLGPNTEGLSSYVWAATLAALVS